MPPVLQLLQVFRNAPNPESTRVFLARTIWAAYAGVGGGFDERLESTLDSSAPARITWAANAAADIQTSTDERSQWRCAAVGAGSNRRTLSVPSMLPLV